jgi:hypothetical protein
MKPMEYLTDGWRERVLDHFKSVYPEPVLRFYMAHLVLEATSEDGDNKGGASKA